MKIFIKDDFIKIGQLLKKMNLISSGGEALLFLNNNIIKINGETPIGRGSKVFVGTILLINEDLYRVLKQ